MLYLASLFFACHPCPNATLEWCLKFRTVCGLNTAVGKSQTISPRFGLPQPRLSSFCCQDTSPSSFVGDCISNCVAVSNFTSPVDSIPHETTRPSTVSPTYLSLKAELDLQPWTSPISDFPKDPRPFARNTSRGTVVYSLISTVRKAHRHIIPHQGLLDRHSKPSHRSHQRQRHVQIWNSQQIISTPLTILEELHLYPFYMTVRQI